MIDDSPSNDTRSRMLETALKLFSQHGMEGTSLQMIADELGVTKAAVYYYFKTKDEIAEALVGPKGHELNRVLDEAQAKRGRSAQIDHALEGFVGVIVRNRTLFRLIHSDPAIRRVNDQMRARNVGDLKAKLQAIFSSGKPSLSAVITVHVVFAGLSMVCGSPEYANVDTETLRQHLLDVGRRLLRHPRR